MLLTRNYRLSQTVFNITSCARSLHFDSTSRYRHLSPGCELKSDIVTLGNKHSLKQVSSKDAIQAVENCFYSNAVFLKVSIMMENENDHGDKEEATFHDQQRKREREKGALGEASPPTKKRVRESDGEECELSHDSRDERQDVVEDDIKNEAVTSELSEDEFKKPLLMSDQVGQLLKLRTDSVDSLDESIQSTENLSSCDVSLGFNETECESLESSLVCLGNSLEDISVDVLDEEKETVKNEPEGEHYAFDDRAPKAKKKKRKNKRKMSKADQESGESKHSTNTRPNYFVGVQVSDCEIHKNLIKVQEELVAFEPALCKALVDVATSHITLLIARLEDENALSAACSALEDYSKERDLNEKPIQLTFSGIDNFSNNVLYARVIEDEHHQRLLDVADSLRQFFTEKGVCMPNMKPLNPHLTIAKMSKAPRGKGKPGPRKIEPVSYTKYKNIHFGCQPVKSLQLLAMNHPKDENRYYYCCKEIHFGKDIHENSDHTQCCFPRRPVVSSQHRRSFSTKPSEDPVNISTKPSEDPLNISTKPSEDPLNIVASSVGFVTALAASLMIVYVVGKVSGKI